MYGNRAVQDRLEMPPASPPPVQRDVAPGSALPNVTDLAESHYKEQMGGDAAISRAAEARIIPDLMARSGNQAMYQTAYAKASKLAATRGTWMPDIHKLIPLVTNAVAAIPNPSLNPQQDFRAAQAAAQNAARPDPVHIVFAVTFFHDVTNYAEAQAKAPLNQAVTNFMQGFLGLQMQVPNAQQKTAWASALKSMPWIATLLTDKDRALPKPDSRSRFWQDGGGLDDAGNVVIDTNGLPPKKQVRTDIDNGKVYERIARADRFLKSAVDQQYLNRINKPQVVVKTMYASGEKAGGFFKKVSDDQKWRAHQLGNKVVLAQNDDYSIFVHEVGHYIETMSDGFVWRDVHKLMADRHAGAGGANVALLDPTGAAAEGRYGGDYPVTGNYTSKVYASGSTEVVSMTLEYLSRPSDTLRMIEGDPQQTAVVLRGLKPTEYNNHHALRAFDQFLPH